MNKLKKWSILLYVMLLINIALVVWIVVYNNSYVIVNNIDVWNNQEEVFSNIYNKWNISIESVLKYNSNWEWFLDGISCPQDITMSWSENRATWIPTTQIYEYWKVHCRWSYNGNDFKILYDDEVNDFTMAQYQWDVVNIIEAAWTDIEVDNDRINLNSSDVDSSYPYQWYVSARTIDNNLSTNFISNNRSKNEFLEYDLWSERSIWKIIIRKYTTNSNQYWNKADLTFKDRNGNTVFNTTLSSMRNKNYIEIDLKYRGLTNDVETIRIETRNKKYLHMLEFEIYELQVNGNDGWEGDRVFVDSDNTFMTFTDDWIQWNDWIDDDLNSDNYKVTSIGNTYFPNNYQDDDVVPRKTIFWSIPAQSDYQHVYWNNYKTIDIVENNPNNDDLLNIKMWDVNDAHVFINTFNTEDLDYNIKILEFDREVYKNQFTLLPLNSYEGKNIDKYLGFLQLNPWDNTLWVAKENTPNDFIFDFQNKDYAIFFSNNADSLLSYHLEAYNSAWAGIYINPIDDSWTGTIKVLSNHIIIWWEKNFIWENFEVVWSK